MLYLVMPTSLQNIVEAYHVRLDISIRIGDAIANTCLCSQIHHYSRLILAEDVIDGVMVSNIALNKLPSRTFRNTFVQLTKTILFQPHIVVVIDIVNTNDGCPLHVFE